MYVGVDLDATARMKAPRPRPPPPPLSQLNIPLSSGPDITGSTASDKKGLRRSKSFTPPSNRLTQPTKSQARRRDMVTGGQVPGAEAGAASSRSGAASARSPSPGSARNTLAGCT